MHFVYKLFRVLYISVWFYFLPVLSFYGSFMLPY